MSALCISLPLYIVLLGNIDGPLLTDRCRKQVLFAYTWVHHDWGEGMDGVWSVLLNLLVFCVYFCILLLSVACAQIHGFWLPFWYLQTLLACISELSILDPLRFSLTVIYDFASMILTHVRNSVSSGVLIFNARFNTTSVISCLLY